MAGHYIPHDRLFLWWLGDPSRSRAQSVNWAWRLGAGPCACATRPIGYAPALHQAKTYHSLAICSSRAKKTARRAL